VRYAVNPSIRLDGAKRQRHPSQLAAEADVSLLRPAFLACSGWRRWPIVAREGEARSWPRAGRSPKPIVALVFQGQMGLDEREVADQPATLPKLLAT